MSTFTDIPSSCNHLYAIWRAIPTVVLFFDRQTSGRFIMTPHCCGKLRRLWKIGTRVMYLHDDYLVRWSTTAGRAVGLGGLLFTVIHRIHQVWNPWRIDRGNVMIFLILSFLCVIRRRHAFTMLILDCFLIFYAQHYTCCILPYASHFTMHFSLVYHMFTLRIPCRYSMDIHYIN